MLHGRWYVVRALIGLLDFAPQKTALLRADASSVAFTVVTDTVFVWPGMGKLIIDAIRVLERAATAAHLRLIVVIFIVDKLVLDTVG